MNHPQRAPRTVLAPADQAVSFAELFFDLVFVFAVTQVVALLHDGFTWLHAGQALLVFWLVWWAWTQFTWALNAANTEHGRVLLLTILAAAAAFFMAIGVPAAYTDNAWWFALSYVFVRGIGLLAYIWVSWGDPALRRAVMLFALVSVAGLLAVLVGGYLGGPVQYLGWGLAILLDVVAAMLGASREGWRIRPRHFTERHGLFVIIALGETLIVAASGADLEHISSPLIFRLTLPVGISACLWWLYFVHLKHHLEAGLVAPARLATALPPETCSPCCISPSCAD